MSGKGRRTTNKWERKEKMNKELITRGRLSESNFRTQESNTLIVYILASYTYIKTRARGSKACILSPSATKSLELRCLGGGKSTEMDTVILPTWHRRPKHLQTINGRLSRFRRLARPFFASCTLFYCPFNMYLSF